MPPLKRWPARLFLSIILPSEHAPARATAIQVKVRYDAGQLAKEKGAVAVLIRSIGTDSHRFPHTGVTTLSGDPLPAAALSAPDADQLARIMARGQSVRISLFIRVAYRETGHSWNVIAQVNGRETPEKVVLIGAHLDSWDLGTGAVDDGAGCRHHGRRRAPDR